jgi:O-antigen/teichoic acid export membrane protein
MNTKNNNLTPDAKVTRSIGRNTLFGVISNLAQVGTRLITVPIVIHYLGLGGYGIWNIIMMTATYMRFGSVGVKTAFQKYVAEATGDGDYARANKLLSTGTILMIVLSVCGLIPIALFSLPIAKLVGVPTPFLKASAGAISLLALIMLMANAGAAFESIITGGHRIDIVTTFRTVLTVMEAVAIVVALYFGSGLFTMACIMGASELVYISGCYFTSHWVVPQIQVRLRYFSTGTFRELLRFAASYQLVNVLEVLYAALVPFAILRAFGATSAGVYAVASRVVGSAAILQEAFLPPILSGGTMVFASGSAERMQALVAKAYKVVLALSLFPLGFISMFGVVLVYAWTGEADPSFRVAFWLTSLTTMFGAISRLAFVLYRVSGRALLDNVWQGLRVALICAVMVFAPKLGFVGVLGGVAVIEMLGMLFMLFALTRAFHLFRALSLVPDLVRITLAVALILLVGAVASSLPVPGGLEGRLPAILKLVEACAACMLVAWPLAVRTRVITATDRAALLNSFFPNRNQGGGGLEGGAQA